MKLYVKTILIFLLPISAQSQSIERQTVSSTGNFAQNTVGSLSFTVGEPTIVLGSSSTSLLLQGFQQPTPIIRTGIFVTASDEPCKFAIFPNPTAESLNYQSATTSSVFEVFDLVGKSYGKYKASNGAIDVANLSAGTYFLRLDCDGASAFSQKFVKL